MVGPEPTLPLIGITGGIASGKSLVAQYLREHEWSVIDADQLGHRVLEPGQPSYHRILQTFGQEILNTDNTINRRALGAIVFSNAEQLKKLNSISHPLIAEMVREEVRCRIPQAKGGVLFLEAAVLIEANWHKMCQQVWVVYTEPHIARERLTRRNRFTPEEAQARIASQLSNSERNTHAHQIIANNGTINTLYQTLNNILKDFNAS